MKELLPFNNDQHEETKEGKMNVACKDKKKQIPYRTIRSRVEAILQLHNQCAIQEH